MFAMAIKQFWLILTKWACLILNSVQYFIRHACSYLCYKSYLFIYFFQMPWIDELGSAHSLIAEVSPLLWSCWITPPNPDLYSSLNNEYNLKLFIIWKPLNLEALIKIRTIMGRIFIELLLLDVAFHPPIYADFPGSQVGLTGCLARNQVDIVPKISGTTGSSLRQECLARGLYP